jgi:hypothetical protein
MPSSGEPAKVGASGFGPTGVARYVRSSSGPSNWVTSSFEGPTRVTSSSGRPTRVTSSSARPTRVTSSSDRPTCVTSSSDRPTGVTSSRTVRPTRVTSSPGRPTGVTPSPGVPMRVTSSCGPFPLVGLNCVTLDAARPGSKRVTSDAARPPLAGESDRGTGVSHEGHVAPPADSVAPQAGQVIQRQPVRRHYRRNAAIAKLFRPIFGGPARVLGGPARARPVSGFGRRADGPHRAGAYRGPLVQRQIDRKRMIWRRNSGPPKFGQRKPVTMSTLGRAGGNKASEVAGEFRDQSRRSAAAASSRTARRAGTPHARAARNMSSGNGAVA